MFTTDDVSSRATPQSCTCFFVLFVRYWRLILNYLGKCGDRIYHFIEQQYSSIKNFARVNSEVKNPIEYQELRLKTYDQSYSTLTVLLQCTKENMNKFLLFFYYTAE